MATKFVTREHARIDRIACAWLVRRFVDPDAEILYVPRDDVDRVAAAEGAIPFDVPGVELGHHGEACSFDAFLAKYGLDDPALRKLALIVRGADTSNREIAPEAAGLYAIGSGFQALMPAQFRDDLALLAAESPMYDALYEFCRSNA
jgi:hypothetical protein